MSDDKVVNTILGEVSFRDRGSLRTNMAMIADTIMNRAEMTGVAPHDVVSVRSQYNGYNRPAPGALRFRDMAQDVWSSVKDGTLRGLSKGATYYATPAAASNLPSGLVPTARSTGHMFFADPENRSILTARGYREPDPARLSRMREIDAPVPTPRPDIESRVESYAANYQPAAAATPAQQAIDSITAPAARAGYVSPFGPALPDRVTSPFGYRESPMGIGSTNHKGVDMSIGPGIAGYAARAANAGRVSYAGQMPGYGNMVEVTHDDGMTTRYGHLGEISVAIGDTVSANDQLGLVGNTGNSTAPHLHFEMMDKLGRQVDPANFIDFSMAKDVPAPQSRASAIAANTEERNAARNASYQSAAASMREAGVKSLGQMPAITRDAFNARTGPSISKANFDARTAPRSAPLGAQFSPSLSAALAGQPSISRASFNDRAGARQISQESFDARFGPLSAPLGPQFSPSLQEAMAPTATKGARPGTVAPTQLDRISVSAPAPSRADRASTRAPQSKAPPSSAIAPTAAQMALFGAGSLTPAQREAAAARAAQETSTEETAAAYGQLAQTMGQVGVSSMAGTKQFDPLQGYAKKAQAATPTYAPVPTARPAQVARPAIEAAVQPAAQQPAAQPATVAQPQDMRIGAFPAAPEPDKDENKSFIDTITETLFSPETAGKVAGAMLAGPIGAQLGGAVGRGISGRGSVTTGSLYDGPVNNIGFGAKAAYGAHNGPVGTQARATDHSVITQGLRGVERYNPATGITTVTTKSGHSYSVNGPGLFGILGGLFGVSAPANSTMGQRQGRGRGAAGRGGLNDYGRGVAGESGQFGGAVDRGSVGLW